MWIEDMTICFVIYEHKANHTSKRAKKDLGET